MLTNVICKSKFYITILHKILRTQNNGISNWVLWYVYQGISPPRLHFCSLDLWTDLTSAYFSILNIKYFIY